MMWESNVLIFLTNNREDLDDPEKLNQVLQQYKETVDIGQHNRNLKEGLREKKKRKPKEEKRGKKQFKGVRNSIGFPLGT
jgi:hypothetical protein